MNDLVTVGKTERGGMVLRDGNPIAVVDGQWIPMHTPEARQVAEMFVQGLIRNQALTEMIEAALVVEQETNRQLLAALQNVAETAQQAIATSNGSMVQQLTFQQQTIAQQNELIKALAARPVERTEKPEVSVNVVTWGYADPMPAIGLLLVTTIAVLFGAVFLHSQSPRVSPQGAIAGEVRHG